ncbi:hypothetical protein FO519_007718 [Halicephalobus sp. NKZ332]|nr:hypothetical protein FO519_007718 [Halicephalobus sp. NKZ332]
MKSVIGILVLFSVIGGTGGLLWGMFPSNVQVDFPFGYFCSFSAPSPPLRDPRFAPQFFNQQPVGGFGRPCGYGNQWGNQQWSNYCNNMRLFQRAGYLILRANLTQSDISNLTSLAENWDVDGIRDRIYTLVNDKFDGPERNESLQLLDELGPPLSFTDALEVFTVEQRAQVILLFKTRRYHDVAVIANGLIASLPDEDQPKARRFIQAVHYLLM